MFIPLSELLARLVVSVVLGGVIGWERETHDRPAGLRTHILVCVGSAVYMIVSLSFTENSDPGRIAAQVATGVGFLGAGTVIRSGSSVKGLTTAASIWAVAAIGLCAGRGEQGYTVAVAATAFVFFTLWGLSWVEKRVVSKRQYRRVALRLRNARETMNRLQSFLDARGVRLNAWEMGEHREDGTQEVRLNLRLPPGLDTDRLTRDLTGLEEVLSVEWD